MLARSSSLVILLGLSLVISCVSIVSARSRTFGNLTISGRQGRSDRNTLRYRGQVQLGAVTFDGSVSISPANGRDPRLHGRGTLILGHMGRLFSGTIEGSANTGVFNFSPDRAGPHRIRNLGWIKFTSVAQPIELHCMKAELHMHGEIIFGANRRGRGPITLEGPLVLDGMRRVVKNNGQVKITTLMPRSRVFFTGSGNIVMNYLLGQLSGTGSFGFHNLTLENTTYTIKMRGPTLAVTPADINIGHPFELPTQRRKVPVSFDLRRATATFSGPMRVMGLELSSASVKIVRDGTMMLSSAGGQLGTLPINSVSVSGRDGAYKAGFNANPVVEGWTFANTRFTGMGTPFTGQGKITYRDGTSCMLELAAAATGTVGTLGGRLTQLKGVPVTSSTFLRDGRKMSGNATFAIRGVGDISMPYNLDDGGAYVRPQQISSIALHGLPMTNAQVSIDRRGIAVDGTLAVGNRIVNDAIFWLRPGGGVRGFGSMPIGRRLVPMVFFSHGDALGGIGEIPCSGKLNMKEITGDKKAKPANVAGTLKINMKGTALTGETNVNVALAETVTKSATAGVGTASGEATATVVPVGTPSRQVLNLDSGLGLVLVPKAAGGNSSHNLDILQILGFK